MKKVIIVEVLLLFILGVTLASGILFCMLAKNMLDFANAHPSYFDSITFQADIKTYLSYGIPCLLAALADLAAIVIIAIKDFQCFKPLVDKFRAKRDARKQEIATAKAKKAEADKQARIEQLTAELEQLKKDE